MAYSECFLAIGIMLLVGSATIWLCTKTRAGGTGGALMKIPEDVSLLHRSVLSPHHPDFSKNTSSGPTIVPLDIRFSSGRTPPSGSSTKKTYVLQRAHHHVIWSRVPDYKPETLQELQSTDGAVFEYWNHASSILPARDYRYSLPLMEKYRSEMHWANDSAELRSAMRRVYAQIRGKGPLRIGEVESKGTYASGWTDSGVTSFQGCTHWQIGRVSPKRFSLN